MGRRIQLGRLRFERERREHLAPLLGNRMRIVGRAGQHERFKMEGGKQVYRVCVKYIRDMQNRPVCDHAWMVLPPGVKLQPKATYCMTALVKRYEEQREWTVSDGWAVIGCRYGLDSPQIEGMLPSWAAYLLRCEAQEMDGDPCAARWPAAKP